MLYEQLKDVSEYVHLIITSVAQSMLRDRSLFIVQGGIEEKLGGPLNFFKPERGEL